MGALLTQYIKATRTDKTSTFAGNVTVSGNFTVNGNFTFGNAITDSLSVSGLYKQGTNATPLVLTAGTPVFTLYTTCSSTNGSTSAEPFYVKSTMTGAGGVGGRARFHMYTNVALAGWSNALKAYAEYGASGKTTGLGSAFCAEMDLSAGTNSGTYAPLEIELNTPTGVSLGTLTAFEYMSVQGVGVGTFDTGGFIWSIQGLTAGANNTFRTGLTAATVNAATTAALRVKIGAVTYFIPLATATV